MNDLLRRSITPFGIIILTTTASFLAWIFPGFDGRVRKGFISPYPVDTYGILICVLWLTTIIVCAFSGFKIGLRLRLQTKILNSRVSIDAFRPYLIISSIAHVGILYVFLQLIGSLGVDGIISAVSGGQANTLKNTLYDSYSVGIVSLRYLAIPAAALAFYHIIRRRYIFISILNILALALLSIISSRLSLIFAIFTALPILVFKLNLRISKRAVLITFIVMFHLLAALNYSRNISFYRSIGISNFYAAGFSEIITYIGSPFQGFLATGQLGDRLEGTSDVTASNATGVSLELSTNSAFLELTRSAGVLQAFLTAAFSTLFGSFIMGIALRNKDNLLFLLFGAVGYCFAEIWRIYLFGQGIVYTIVVMLIAVTLWCVYIPPLRRSRNSSAEVNL